MHKFNFKTAKIIQKKSLEYDIDHMSQKYVKSKVDNVILYGLYRLYGL